MRVIWRPLAQDKVTCCAYVLVVINLGFHNASELVIWGNKERKQAWLIPHALNFTIICTILICKQSFHLQKYFNKNNTYTNENVNFYLNIGLLISLFIIIASNIGPSLITNSIIRCINISKFLQQVTSHRKHSSLYYFENLIRSS